MPEPISDEDLQKVTVTELVPHNSTIRLDEYTDEWPRLYEREAARITGVLGGVVRRIEHAGSTSVPGLPAKPIIDIVLEVPDSADEDAYVAPLEAHGYTLRIREADWFEHRLFKGPDTNINLHVFTAGCEEVERMLRFRDHLRAHPADRDRYAAAKRELSARVWRHVQHYADAKSEVVREILARAR
ncbi:GrpB family protein [Actinokineospora bangkokensis]|uniref:GrpB family protein n=1 Tax=Actinokineospora bangkokensis TaxID=1193682 RepID=A0A1Q9LTS4_9PSEU|nr:GrpB family protein [Actinokineospora bangkokensis]OLR95428.1 hypothetical protein BJP25_06695 [Actinokineospora bangkokensis]